jgi:2',3'-cyclic-nucleotide 2'-phosphodiesterase (5'-nucleotidase family)
MGRFFLGLITVLCVSCGVRNFQYYYFPAVSVSNQLQRDSSMVNYLKPYKDSLKVFTAGNVGKTDTGYFTERPSCNLGNLCADLVLRTADSVLFSKTKMHADMAVLNLGGLRTALPNGLITMGNMYEVMPFENNVVVVKVHGSAMDSLFRHIIQRGGEPVSGLKLEVDEKQQYIAWIGGKRFDSRRDYWVATSDYLALGGDAYTMFKSSGEIVYTRISVRNALAGGIWYETVRYGVVQRRTERRVVYANEASVPKK